MPMTISKMSDSKFHPVTHVIFDMDGLLLDTEPRYEKAISAMCRKYGSEYTHEAKMKVLGTTARGGAEAAINHLKLPVTVDKYIEEIEDLYEGIFSEYIPFLPGAEKLVKHLKEHNIPICIATSSKDTTFKMKSKHHPDFFPLFSHVVRGSNDPEVKQGKPAPDIFFVAAKRFDKPPAEMKDCLVFEDSANGVRAGLAAGMQTVWVPAATTDTSGVEATLMLPSLEKFQPELFGLPPFKEEKV